MGYNLMAPERRRVVLESAVRTGKIAFADPPVEDLATEVPPTESPLADLALGPVTLDEPSIALDLDVNRSEHG
jgi:hypothetical protein